MLVAGGHGEEGWQRGGHGGRSRQKAPPTRGECHQVGRKENSFALSFEQYGLLRHRNMLVVGGYGEEGW